MHIRSFALWGALLLWPAVAAGQNPTKAGRHPHTTLSPAQPLGAAATPYTVNRVQEVGNLWINITNYGMFGAPGGSAVDPCTGLQAPSLEFPGGSGTVNLWEGSLWVGAVRGHDTLVSIGASIWPLEQHELFPAAYPAGTMTERTTRERLKAPHGSRCPDVLFDKKAKSDYDVISVYYDTLHSSQLVINDPDDGRPHEPLGVEVTQSSYSWSLPFAQDFILLDYAVRNVGHEPLQDTYLGLYIDQDIHTQSNSDGWLDDLCGFLKTVPSQFGEDIRDTVSMVWASDNDGDPANGKFNSGSNSNVTGVRVLKLPGDHSRVTFNWFVGDGGSLVDWGPVQKTSKVEFLRAGLGAPYGDKAKYEMMSNREIDYDQMESAIDHQADGWLPPAEGSRPPQIADGWDIRYLLAAGPVDLPVDSTASFTVALVAGENFHAQPSDFATFWDPSDPDAYRSRLDFSDFVLNSRWADWVYDTPGFDTDGDGYKGAFRMVNGEPVYYRGDGVPDFSGPPAPPPPGDLRFETTPGKVVVHWNGSVSEKSKDPFLNLADFEGYRIYMSRTGLAADYVLLAQRDRVDYERHLWQAQRVRWLTPDPPFTLDSLKQLYDSLSLVQYGKPFHPDDYSVARLDQAFREIRLNTINLSLDTLYYYFTPFDANNWADDASLAQAASSGREILSVIRKVYPGASPDSVATRDDGTTYYPYYEYEFGIDGLQRAEPVYFAVTVFDYGYPGVGLDPLETSPISNSVLVWPVNAASVVNAERPAPGVYPNPYRLADFYNASGWEDPRREGLDPERARKVTFTNVPDTCVVSIFSLDGDLVRRIDHHADPASSDATIVVWDLITRNTQAVKSGLYLWTIESRFGVDVGKLVIVK